MLIAKIQRHEAWSTITPPASGPTIIAIPLQAVQEPIALPRTSARERGDDDRERARRQQRAGRALQRARRDQRPVRRRDRAREREHAERGDPEHEHAPLAVDVAERAADQDQRAEREHVGVRDPLLRLEPAAEVVLDRGERDVDDRPVDRGDARAEDRGDERRALDSASPRPTVVGGAGPRCRREPRPRSCSSAVLGAVARGCRTRARRRPGSRTRAPAPRPRSDRRSGSSASAAPVASLSVWHSTHSSGTGTYRPFASRSGSAARVPPLAHGPYYADLARPLRHWRYGRFLVQATRWVGSNE